MPAFATGHDESSEVGVIQLGTFFEAIERSLQIRREVSAVVLLTPPQGSRHRTGFFST